jgi:cobalt-precorrin-5B (C1)-methyltransferase
LKAEKMRDPVTGFVYPDAWVERCRDPYRLHLAEEGLAVLTASGTVLVRGYTTGTTAAAACMAAVLTMDGPPALSVPITLPCHITVDVPVNAEDGRSVVRKFGGDYPDDVTAGIEFVAVATPAGDGVRINFGEGIGRFSRDTPRYKQGDPAVSPPAHACIVESVREAMESAGLPGVRIELFVPEGRVVAEKTLNPRVGVLGGISVLGSTGLVEPWDDHLTESSISRISAAHRPILTTGRIGLRFARLRYPEDEVILIGGKIGESLAAIKGEAILFGLPALILRHLQPGILDGTGYGTVEELAASPSFGPIVKDVLTEFSARTPGITVILIDREGNTIGESA